MDLTTRCPQCGTIFAASLEQLTLRKGYIRCISCANIFDGYEAVVSPGDAQASGANRPEPTMSLPAPPVAIPLPPKASSPDIGPPPEPVVDLPRVLRQRQSGKSDVVVAEHVVPAHPALPSGASDTSFTISTGPRAHAVPSRQDPVFGIATATDVRPEPQIGRPRAGGAGAEPRPGSRNTATVPPEAVMTEPPPQIIIEPRRRVAASGSGRGADFIHDAAPPSRSWAAPVWTVLVVAGLLVLFAQLAYVYRAQIANAVPFTRPVLEQACVSLSCSVPYSRRIDQISIMSSSLRAGASPAAGAVSPPSEAGGQEARAAAKAPAKAQHMVLQLTMRNTYDKPQEWPTLVLDLTDFSGTLILRKNLAPENYLAQDVLERPFPPGSEVTVTLPVVLDGLQVNGYQLGKFFQ